MESLGYTVTRFNPSRSGQAVFLSSCAVLQSPRQCVRVLIPPHRHRHSLPSDVLMPAVFVGLTAEVATGSSRLEALLSGGAICVFKLKFKRRSFYKCLHKKNPYRMSRDNSLQVISLPSEEGCTVPQGLPHPPSAALVSFSIGEGCWGAPERDTGGSQAALCSWS